MVIPKEPCSAPTLSSKYPRYLPSSTKRASLPFAAKKYGVEVVGITISKEQARLAKERCKDLDVEIKLQDYRDLTGKFDLTTTQGTPPAGSSHPAQKKTHQLPQGI